MNVLPVVNPRQSDPLIKIHKLRIKKSYLDSNEKIIDYLDENKKCKKCHLLMDPVEKGICKYCKGDYFE